MKHRFNLYNDIILPVLYKISGHRYGCCDKIKNCTRCCKKNGYDDWAKKKQKEPERQPSNNYKYTKEEKRRAWLDKYILGIASPSAVALGYKYRWDMIKAHEEEAKHGGK